MRLLHRAFEYLLLIKVALILPKTMQMFTMKNIIINGVDCRGYSQK